MPTIQEKFAKADPIVWETRTLLKLQKKWWKTGKEDDLDRVKAQGKKVEEMINAYYPNNPIS